MPSTTGPSDDDRASWPPGYRRGPEPNPFADLVDREDPVIEVVDWDLVPILRRMTPGERIERACELWRYARGVAESAVRARHPDWPDHEVRDEVARRVGGGPVRTAQTARRDARAA